MIGIFRGTLYILQTRRIIDTVYGRVLTGLI